MRELLRAQAVGLNKDGLVFLVLFTGEVLVLDLDYLNVIATIFGKFVVLLILKLVYGSR